MEEGTKTFELPESVTALKDIATGLQGDVSSLAGGEYTIGDMLETAVRDAYKDNEDVITKLDTSQANYLSTPATLREKYLTEGSPDYQPNPFAADRLIQQGTSNAMVPYLTYSGIYGQRVGRIADLIQSGTNAFQAAQAQTLAKAQQAWQNYQTALEEYTTLEGLRQTERGLDIQQYNAEKPSGGGSSFAFPDWMEDIFRNLIPGNQPQKPPPPAGRWMSAISDDGMWFWDANANDWIPIVD